MGWDRMEWKGLRVSWTFFSLCFRHSALYHICPLSLSLSDAQLNTTSYWFLHTDKNTVINIILIILEIKFIFSYRVSLVWGAAHSGSGGFTESRVQDPSEVCPSVVSVCVTLDFKFQYPFVYSCFCYTVLYSTQLYCTVLYCTVLYRPYSTLILHTSISKMFLIVFW